MTDLKHYQKEIFIDIKGYEGLYQISNKGNVKSLKRNVIDKHGNSKTLKSKILKTHYNDSKNVDENHRVQFYKNKKRSVYYIKDLVYIHFSVIYTRTLNYIKFQRLAIATRNLDNTARTVRFLEIMSQSNWKIYSASERKQMFRALANERDTLRRHNKAVERIHTYNSVNDKSETRGGNRPQCLKGKSKTSLLLSTVVMCVSLFL